jgi:hypothetical protein
VLVSARTPRAAARRAPPSRAGRCCRAQRDRVDRHERFIGERHDLDEGARLGRQPYLQRGDEGYFLDPEVEVVHGEELDE